MTLTNGQQPLYACLNHQQTLSGVSIIGGGGDPENGFGTDGFFLDGEEVPPTSFLTSGYDPAHHTAEGMVTTDATIYAPVFAQAVVDLLNAPSTIVMDAETGDGSSSGACRLYSDDPFFLMEVSRNYIGVQDDNVAVDSVLTGPGRFKVAMSRSDGRIAMSVNGNAVQFDDGAVSPLPTLTTVILRVSDDVDIIREFTILPLQDEGDLPTLSAF